MHRLIKDLSIKKKTKIAIVNADVEQEIWQSVERLFILKSFKMCTFEVPTW